MALDDRSGFVQYRPLVGEQIERVAGRLAALPDAQIAVDELRREPHAAIFGQSPFEALLLPLLGTTAEAAGGFDWSDNAFERAYERLEETLFGDRFYVGVAPLTGLSVRSGLQLATGLRVREGPELVVERTVPREQTQLPDGPGEIADAVTALRLATNAPVAAGPVVVERLQAMPVGKRPVPAIASSSPPGEPTLLDEFRGRLARDVLERLLAAQDDTELGEAIDRWELSLFTADSDDQLRESLAVLLGGGDGLFAATARVAILLGDTPSQRGELFARLREEAPDRDLIRRALVEVVMHGDRLRLIERLDESLLGLSPRPPSYFSARLAS